MATKPSSPSFTFKGRRETNEVPVAAPYRALPSSIGSGPKISLASRHATRDSEVTPGPSYVPPPLGADAKKSTMSFRHQESRSLGADNPGPGSYDIPSKFGNDAQKSSMHARTNDQFGIGTQSPGPGAYAPDYSSQFKRAPSATMHVRTEQKRDDFTPGPGAYSISRELGGKGSVFHVRATSSSAASSTPGPGAYSPSSTLFSSGPKYTMKSRHESSSRPTTAPYRALPSSIGSGPKISLASRHATRDSEVTPGPSYVPPPLGADAKKSTMSFRHQESRSLGADNPGPGSYDIPSKFGNDAPKSTMHARTNDQFGVGTQSPGPGAYAPDYSSQFKRAPSATMHIRTRTNQPESTPGYYDIGSTLTGPKYTIGRRESLGLIQV
jgi:hypothetical protein